jgi:hypothetical protein
LGRSRLLPRLLNQNLKKTLAKTGVIMFVGEFHGEEKWFLQETQTPRQLRPILSALMNGEPLQILFIRQRQSPDIIPQISHPFNPLNPLKTDSLKNLRVVVRAFPVGIPQLDHFKQTEANGTCSR